MKPEEVDKLFKDRLGNSAPTPPADLWNRLQERIEPDMPQAQPEEEEKNYIFIVWSRSYGIAAAVALLLAAGLVFFSLRINQNDHTPAIAQTEATAPDGAAEIVAISPAERTDAPTEAAAEAVTTNKSMARTPAAMAHTEDAPANAVARASAPKPAGKRSPLKQVEPLEPAIPDHALATITGQEKPEIIMPDAPVALVAAATAESQRPVEIIIKRVVSAQPEAQHQEEEITGMEKKQQIARNIFKQVKNLATGERVELSELGIRTEQIALETQIGKQKFSKVINL